MAAREINARIKPVTVARKKHGMPARFETYDAFVSADLLNAVRSKVRAAF